MPTLEEIYGTSGPTERLAYNLTPQGLQNPDVDSSTGGMTWTGDGPLVTINGKQYIRLRTNDPAAISSFDAFGGGVFRDPTYGYVVPLEVATARTASSDDFIDKYGVALAGAGLAAGPMAASLGAGAAGATEGAFTPDLSGYLTGVDTGPGFLDPTLTSGLEGVAYQPGIHDFYGSLGENAGIGSTATDVLTGSAASAAIPGTGAMQAMGSGLGGLGSGIMDFLNSPLASTLLGKVAPAALGAYGASQQAGAYEDMFNKYFGMGAPFRSLLQQSYQPGFSMMNEPGYADAINVAQDNFLRAASAGRAQGVSKGNPLDTDNPGAWGETMKYVLGSTALPALTNYRSGLMGAGQLGLGPSASFGNAQIQSQGGIYDAIGYGLGEIFNPRPKGIQLNIGGGGSIDEFLRRTFTTPTIASSGSSL